MGWCIVFGGANILNSFSLDKSTIHRLLQYNEMDKDVMLYVCLSGDLPGTPMSLTPPPLYHDLMICVWW